MILQLLMQMPSDTSKISNRKSAISNHIAVRAVWQHKGLLLKKRSIPTPEFHAIWTAAATPILALGSCPNGGKHPTWIC